MKTSTLAFVFACLAISACATADDSADPESAELNAETGECDFNQGGSSFLVKTTYPSGPLATHSIQYKSKLITIRTYIYVSGQGTITDGQATINCPGVGRRTGTVSVVSAK